jgi:hypothetical protein
MDEEVTVFRNHTKASGLAKLLEPNYKQQRNALLERPGTGRRRKSTQLIAADRMRVLIFEEHIAALCFVILWR